MDLCCNACPYTSVPGSPFIQMPVLNGKNLNAKYFNQLGFLSAMFVSATDLYHLTPLAVALALAEGHKSAQSESSLMIH